MSIGKPDTPSEEERSSSAFHAADRKKCHELEEPRLASIIPPYGRIKKVEGGEKREQQGLPALTKANDVYR